MKLKDLLAALKNPDRADGMPHPNTEVVFDTVDCFDQDVLSVYWDEDTESIRVDISEEKDSPIRPDTLNCALNNAAEQYVETIMEEITDDERRPRHWRRARDLIKSAKLDIGFKKIILDYVNSMADQAERGG